MKRTPALNDSYTFLALGDSYTIGEGVDASVRWPVQLAERLRQDGIDVIDPDIIAQTGWATNELRDAIRDSDNHKTYDLVSLLIGVNNQYRGRSLNRYRTDFQTLLKTAVSLADGNSGRVFVLSIPDWSVSPFARRRNRAKIAAEIDAFNAVVRDECQEADIIYVNITPLSRQAVGDPAFAADGLHYSGEQMRHWVELALPTVKWLLKEP